MKQFRNTVIRAGLGALYLTGAHHLLQPIFAGVGAIFMLHHVRPGRDAEFQPNRHLEVAPEFLRAALSHLRARGIDIIPMDEVQRRLIERDFSRRFACFTFDDGYRDNRDFALPVMREFEAPLTMYVASDFAHGIGRLWWLALEMVIAGASAIEVPIGGVATRLDTATASAKQIAYDRLHLWLRGLPDEQDMQRVIGALCARHGVDQAAICRELCMSWDELKPFADDPLINIGAHSITHCNLARQTEEIADLAHLRRARDLIDRDYAQPLDVLAMARTALMSPAHFSRKFRAAYGETPYTYLMTRRMERAKAFLRQGMSVTDTCIAVGCTSLGSFSSRFTEVVGETPSRYRARDHRGYEVIPSCVSMVATRPRRFAVAV